MKFKEHPNPPYFMLDVSYFFEPVNKLFVTDRWYDIHCKIRGPHVISNVRSLLCLYVHTVPQKFTISVSTHSPIPH